VPDDSASTYSRGFPEATLLTNGLRIETLADPVRDGLATARTETEKATTGKARWTVLRSLTHRTPRPVGAPIAGWAVGAAWRAHPDNRPS
jgi:hypothetical protein